MTIDSIQWIVVLGAGVLTVLLLLRLLFFVHDQNKKIGEFEQRLHNVEDAKEHQLELEENK